MPPPFLGRHGLQLCPYCICKCLSYKGSSTTFPAFLSHTPAMLVFTPFYTIRLKHRVYVPPCVCSLRVYISPCVYLLRVYVPSVRISLRVYVPSVSMFPLCVCPSRCVYPPRVSLRVYVLFVCILYLYVHVCSLRRSPPCICFLHASVRVSHLCLCHSVYVPPRMFLPCVSLLCVCPSAYISPMYVCPSMCMSLHVYVTSCICLRLYVLPLYVDSVISL